MQLGTTMMKNKLLILSTCVFAIALTSCVFCSYPKEQIRPVGFNFSDDNISFTFRTDKKNLLNFCSRLSDRLTSYSDSTFSTTFQVGDDRIFATAKGDLTNKDSVATMRLRLIDTLTFYPDRDGDDTAILYAVDKVKCLAAFQKNYIPYLVTSLNNCLKVDSLYFEGIKQINSGQLDKAYELFLAVTKTDLSNNDLFKFEKYSALNRMGFIKLQQKQYDKSIDFLNKALHIEPWWLNLNNRTQFRTNGKLPDWVKDKYIDELKSEYKYNSENTEQLLLHANLALAYLNNGKFKESKSAIDKAEKLYPLDPYLILVKDLYKNKIK